MTRLRSLISQELQEDQRRCPVHAFELGFLRLLQEADCLPVARSEDRTLVPEKGPGGARENPQRADLSQLESPRIEFLLGWTRERKIR